MGGCCSGKAKRKTWKVWGEGYYELPIAQQKAKDLRNTGRYARVLLTDRVVREGKTFVKINILPT